MSSYTEYLCSKFDSRSEPLSLQDTMNAMRLANCLILNDDLQRALSCLKDVVYFQYETRSKEHWTWNVYGLAMLSELAYKLKGVDIEKYYSLLRSYTWLPNDAVSYASKVLSNHRGTMTLPEHMSKDDLEERYYVCEEFCDEILELRYFYEYFFMAKKPSLHAKYRLRGISVAKSESEIELLRLGSKNKLN